MVGKFMGVYVSLGAAISFETPEIMEISDETMDAFYAACPALERFRRYLTNLRRRKAHVLSAAEEKLLAAAGEMSQTPDTVYGMFADADLKFADAIDSEGNAHTVTQALLLCI
jgi:oligoendopeptidase F